MQKPSIIGRQLLLGRLLMGSSTFVAAMALAPAAHAQQAPATDAAAPDETAAKPDGEIIVTGSRVTTDGSRQPTPVTVVSAEQLQLASPGQIGEALNQLPVFRGSTRPSSAGTGAVGPDSGSFLNLRNLGAQRTLVLLDGRRGAPSAINGTIDTNLLPQSLVKRVDVVTGGASAAYGSDAVAGVVNFVLDTHFTGVKGLAQAGVSTEGLGESYKVNLTVGTEFAGGRGHLVASGDYYRTPGIQSTTDRAPGSLSYGTLTDPTSSKPQLLLIRPGLRSSLTTYGGLIVSPGPLNLMQFAPDGTLTSFNKGGIRGSINQVGGDGAIIATNLTAAVTTKSGFFHAEFDLTPTLTIFAQAGVSEVHNRYTQIQQFNTPGYDGITIFSGNAFLNPSVQSVMTANNLASFQMGRLNTDFGKPAIGDALNQTVDFTAGLTFKPGGSWVIDAYYERGHNKQTVLTENNIDLQKFYAATDAVRDPGTNQIVCRVSLTNPGAYPGCVPINLFGQGAPSKAAIDYVKGTSTIVARTTQDVASASVRGTPFSTWAGPVSIAVGGEYRSETIDQTTNDVAQRINTATGIRGFPSVFLNGQGGWLLSNVQPVKGSYDIREGFGEVAVPLARDLPFIKSFDLNAAVRYTDYSISGGVTTWKVGGVWEVVDGVRLRATQSRDIRAPNVPELFTAGSQGAGSVIISGVTTPVIVQTVGSTNLTPEKADTTTVGMVLTPAFVPGLTLSADYYNIRIKDVIATFTAQQVIDQCAAGNASACAGVIRNSSNVVTRVISSNMNLGRLETAGIDFELGYRPRGPVLGGGLTTRVMVSYLDKQISYVRGGVPIDSTGEVGMSSNPRWSGTASVDWRRGGFGLFTQGRLIGGGIFNKTRVQGVTIENNNVPAIFYLDTTISYDINRRFKAYITANNLFDTDPPILPRGTLGYFSPTNSQLYDVVGRYLSFGVKVSL